MQKNWIGRSEGLESASPRGAAAPIEPEIKVYTTRPDTLFGAKFLAIAADHPIAGGVAPAHPALQGVIEECRRTGTAQAPSTRRRSSASTPAEGPPPPRPVLAAAGLRRELRAHGVRHGAVFGCPAHDQRDLDFANKYGLGNTPVVCPEDRTRRASSSPTSPMTATGG